MSTIATFVGNQISAWATRDGLDLRKLRFVPGVAKYPLQRDGVDPVPRLVAAEPVTRLVSLFGTDVWLVSGYDAARSVLADGQTYSNDLRPLVSRGGRTAAEQIGGLGMTDPPDHTTLRRLLTPEFTRRRLARLQPSIERIVEERLDAMARQRGRVDLVAEFAFPVPFEVICELLGLPAGDRAAFRRLGVARFDLSKGSAGSFGAAAASRGFLIDAVARQRRDPGDGLIGALLREHGDELDDTALGGLADGVFLGGYETSASMLALSAHVLMEHPDVRARIVADPDAVDETVEELLRHLTVVQVAFPRFARFDHQLSGQHIRRGDAVLVSLLGANRDLAPDFAPGRDGAGHLAFGHGMHRCIGAELARMELRTALPALAARFPHLRPATRRLRFRKLSAVYGVDRLPVRLR
ncbi:cytochrome P450 [Nocardioides sp. YIM 152315]|uniref:cytochrome P450 n=1 Tax=Nocardioides sp. YIM 152315 TaxID=3031760 RepID=UPI0023DB5849|nr:cytochrome P450 [Nocardioides sp. YIM 152315]MDF1603150.1 cytochrome P450 [Nocardioides sp. YIM 152315]